MLQFITGSITNPGLSLPVCPNGGISMWALEALFYIRQILLYVYLYGMPSRSPLRMAISLSSLMSRWDSANGSSRWPSLPLPAAIVLKGIRLTLLWRGVGAGNSVPQSISSRLHFHSLRSMSRGRRSNYATPLTAKVLGGATKGAAHRRRGCWSIHRRRRRRDDRRPVGPESRCGTRRCPEGSGPRFEQRRR